jgi:hypothetical protein
MIAGEPFLSALSNTRKCKRKCGVLTFDTV